MIVKSLWEYVKAIDHACSKVRRGFVTGDDSCNEWGGKCYFRGQAKGSWGLLPSLFRCRGKGIAEDCPYTYLLSEAEIIQEVENHYPERFADCKNVIDKLTILQHCGVPTRLLDITTNCLVALYFAVSDQMDDDGKVYVFGVSQAEVRQSYDYETIERYSDIGGVHTKPLVGKVYAECNGQNFRELRPKIHLESNRQFNPLLVSPKHLSERQKRQCGSFFLLPNDKSNGSVEQPCLFDVARIETIEIAIDAKPLIRQELRERYGISRHFLFPESISDFVEEVDAEISRRLDSQKIEEE